MDFKIVKFCMHVLFSSIYKITKFMHLKAKEKMGLYSWGGINPTL